MNDLEKIRQLAQQKGLTYAQQVPAQSTGVAPTTKEPTRPPLCFGKVVIPFELETRHILIVGTTGSGKTQANRALQLVIRQRDYPAIIVDHGGETLARVYDPENSIVLNPFDERSEGWSIFNELWFVYDYYGAATSVIPDLPGENQDWQMSAQGMFADIIKALDEKGDTYRNNAALIYYVFKAPAFRAKDMTPEQAAKTLQGLLENSNSAPLFGPGNEKSLTIIRGIVARHCQPFTLLKEGSFSITEFVLSFEDENEKRWLHLSYSDRSFAAIKPLFGIWISCAIQAAMLLSESARRRFYFFLDELASTGKMPHLQDALEKIRKVGGVVIASIQTTAQLDEHYGAEGAQVLLACFNHLLTLKVTDDKTAEKLSKLYGQTEFWDASYNEGSNFSESASQGGGGGQSSMSTSYSEGVSWQRKKDDVIMPSEFINLPDMEGWARIARRRGEQDYCTATPVSLPYIDMPIVGPKEDTRPDVLLRGRKMPASMRNVSAVTAVA